MKRKWKRTLSVLLSIAMLFSMTGMNTVFATEGSPTMVASGLCEHHTEHSEEVCGYTEGTPEVPCAHEHMDECYKEVTECVHEHTDDCYSAEDSVSDNDATPSDATPKEPTECTHVCSEESGCVTKELDCQHEHDEDCGYIPAVAGTPCAFVCGECAKDSGHPSPEPTPCTRTEGCTLEDGHEGGCNAAVLASPLAAPLADAISIVSISPANGATNVPVDTDIAVTFSRDLQDTDTINISLQYSDGTNSSPHTGGNSGDSGGAVYTANYAHDLRPNTTYTVHVTVHDYSNGTQLLSNTDNTFTTAAAPAVTTVTTAEALKTALTATDAATISVTQNIALAGSVTVGADHTLNIAGGVTVSTGSQSLTIPQDKTLTLSGTGTLEAYTASTWGSAIDVLGTLRLSGGSGLAATNSGQGSSGVRLGQSDTSGTLESDGGHITVANSGDNSTGIAGSGGSTLTLTGGSLTVENTAGTGINNNLTISSCSVTVKNGTGRTYGILNNTTSITDSAVTIENTGTCGLSADTLTVDNCTVTVANSGGTGINMDNLQAAGEGGFNLKDSALTLKNTGVAGLDIGNNQKLMIDGSTVATQASGSMALTVSMSGATVAGANGGKLTLAEGVKLYLSGIIFRDRGVVIDGAGDVTVTAESGPPVNRAITAGDYVWDGAYFTKGGGSGATHTWDGDGASLTNVADGHTIAITSNATGTLAIPDGTTVTITGTVTGAGQVLLNLGAGAKVNWAASYTGSHDSGALVDSLTKTGTIEITGEIINTGTTGAWAITTNSDVIVTGGTVSGTSGGIMAGNVTINAHSMITSTSDTAITADNDVIINGGTIIGGGADYPIAIVAVKGSITLAGGGIMANPGARTVFTNDKPITVTGVAAIIGEVGVPDGKATTITINAGGSLTVLQGYTLTVNNTGTIINNGSIVNDGAIVNNGSITNHAGSTYTGANPTGTGAFTPPPSGATYALSVTSGTGGGSYAEGATVTITANPAPDGARFHEWSIFPSVTFVEGTSKTSQTAKFTMPGQAVTATVIYGGLPTGTYSITVQNDGNGTATANVNSAQQGTAITLTATANSGYRFKEWQVVSGGISIANNSFTMPAANVTIKAIFEEISVGKYALTVTNGSGSGSYEAGAIVTITANAPADGQRFKEWTVNSGSVTLANPQAQSTSFTMPANAVEVTATYEALPADTYSITVQNDGNGTSSANVNSAQQGATITLTATASSDYRFKEWQVVSGGVNIANNSFTMPAANVTVKAIFERIPTTTHTITFNANGGSVTPASAATGADGKLSALPTPTHSGSYRFDGWFTAASGGTQITTATVFTADQTVYAHWTYTGGGNSGGSSGGGGGGSSSSGGGTTTVTPPDPGKPDTATNAETKVTPTVNANGSATVTVPEKSVTDAIKAAQDAAKKAGTEKNGVSVTIDATTTEGANDITATLTEQSVDALIQAGVTEVRIKSDAYTITLDLPALKAAKAVAGGAITVSAKPVAVNTLSAAAQQAIGHRPVFQLTLTSGGKPVTSFGGGSVSVAVPYTLLANEKAGNVQAVCVDGSGKVTWLTNSSYDTNTKMLLFSTGHFSVFGVGYKQDAPAFIDIANHWAKNDIEFVAARGLLSGTGNNQFSPNNSMTRGMFVTALGRLAGVDTNSYKTGKFTDVKADAYYASYVNWAAEKGIISGTTATTFAPDSAVTRQEMAVIMANYAKALGYTVPKTREAVTFADSTNIASWAKDATKAMQMAGVINGKDGNRFDPTGTATRAEVAAVLHRYVELVIDPATAQGWTQNDTGQWLYYENGKPVTGWKQVDGKWYYLDTAGIMQSGGWKQIGGKWYYLYADGSMAVSTEIDGYEVGPDGGRKES